MNLSATLAALAQCVCSTIDTEGLPSHCFCGVVPGDSVLADYAEGCDRRNGVAWVRIALTYPAQVVGVQDTRTGTPPTGLGLDIEVGSIRQFDVDDDPPTEAEALATATLQHDDMMALRKAILCCDALNPKDYILGQYRPMGPLGGMVGGAWTVHLGLL